MHRDFHHAMPRLFGTYTKSFLKQKVAIGAAQFITEIKPNATVVKH
jgi:hypothetical protein